MFLLSLLSKGFERSVYWNEYKMKDENKNTTNEYRYLFESNCVGANRLIFLIFSNRDDNVKRFKAQRYYLAKSVIKNYIVMINAKNIFMTNRLIMI